MFKPDPKTQVSHTFDKLFGRKYSRSVSGERLRIDGRPGHFQATLTVEGRPVATTRSSDWRRAYKLLSIEVEKLYADGATFGS